MIWLAFFLTLSLVVGQPPTSASAPTKARSVAAYQNGPIVRIYLAAFDRVPDQTGLQYWTDVNRAGDSLPSIAGYFIDSAEFRQRYGTPDEEGFVSLLYSNVLNRPPDTSGLDYWVRLLRVGRTRSEVLNEFAQSPEFVAQTASLLETPSEPEQILMIGDSIFHGIRLLDISIGAHELSWLTEEGRHPAALPVLIATARSQGMLQESPIIVIHLGTNGWRSDYVDLFDRELAQLPDHTIYIVNVAADRSWEDAANAGLAQIAQRNGNVELIDWHEAVRQHPDWLRPDGVHPSAAGLRELADLIEVELQAPAPAG